MDSDICRVCRQPEGEQELISIDELLLEEFNLTILESMTICSGSDISRSDGLPYFICDFCRDELKITYIFLQKLQESTEILTKQLRTIEPHIKEECLKDDCSHKAGSPDTQEQQEQVYEFVYEEEDDMNPPKSESEELNVEEIEEELKNYEELDVVDEENIVEEEDEEYMEEETLEYEVEYADDTETPSMYDELEIAGNEEVVTMSAKTDTRTNTEDGVFIKTVRGGFLKKLSDGTNCYQCDSCDKTFKKPDYLSNHVRFVHKKVRPYPCSICGKNFFLAKLNASLFLFFREFIHI